MSVLNTTHKQIFNFWKDKCITESGFICAEGQYDYNKSIKVIKDCGEPECWCCGKFINKIYIHKSYESDLVNDCSKIWEYKEVKSELNRCHIIPKSLGGSDQPENLFLLCEECHYKSPDTDNPTLFLKWIYRMRKTILIDGFTEYKQYYDYIIQECHNSNKDLDTMDIEYIKCHIGTHGGAISPWSIAMLAVDSCKTKP